MTGWFCFSVSFSITVFQWYCLDTYHALKAAYRAFSCSNGTVWIQCDSFFYLIVFQTEDCGHRSELFNTNSKALSKESSRENRTTDKQSDKKKCYRPKFTTETSIWGYCEKGEVKIPESKFTRTKNQWRLGKFTFNPLKAADSLTVSEKYVISFC